jgi:hypothetical protein
MKASYAVVWQEAAAEPAPVYAGKLELDDDAVHLDGVSREGRACHRALGYGELGPMRMARSAERILNRPTLVVERHGAEPLRLGSVDGRGLLAELADQIGLHVLDLMRRRRQAVA